jgi:hypothetical protein
MEPSPAEVCNEYVKRYGMMLKRPINKNSARELDKFFYYFFKVNVFRCSNSFSDKTKRSWTMQAIQLSS